ncbi:LIM domain-containing protein A-like [Senna tora]|uniref:LIM domain-containing protein A-like n=1 Tax=Senna tora TaxID=362788 RepID=A0A834X1G0_9FABA|nr:LIM domain-containing protein A-like [Senna tora]
MVEIKSSALVPQVAIKGRTYNMEYEGLHIVCFNCEKYGHSKEWCAHGDNKANREILIKHTTAVQEEDEMGKELQHESAMKTNLSKDINSEETVIGPWMLVQKLNRRRNGVGRINNVRVNQRSKTHIVSVNGEGKTDEGRKGKTDGNLDASKRAEFTKPRWLCMRERMKVTNLTSSRDMGDSLVRTNNRFGALDSTQEDLMHLDTEPLDDGAFKGIEVEDITDQDEE